MTHKLSALATSQSNQFMVPYQNQTGMGGVLKTSLIYLTLTKLLAGEITTATAADWLRQSPRNVRRLKQRYLKQGPAGLEDGRRHPSPRRAPPSEVALVCKAFGENYSDFSVAHFHEFVVTGRLHLCRSYSWTKKVLQEHGLVRRLTRGERVHRLHRERRLRLGELLHLDGTTHAWFVSRPDLRPTLIVVVDDAASRILYAQMHQREDAVAVLAAMRHVVSIFGVPRAVYTDRAGWFGGNMKDPSHQPAFVRALDRLSIERINAYSPQARGRGERTNRTLQDRLVPELRAVGISTIDQANAYLVNTFIPVYNRTFGQAPAEPTHAFLPHFGVDLDSVFCVEQVRKVRRDNTVHLDGVTMQLKGQAGMSSCASRKVLVRQHLDGTVTVWLADRLLGSFDVQGRKLLPQLPAAVA